MLTLILVILQVAVVCSRPVGDDLSVDTSENGNYFEGDLAISKELIQAYYESSLVRRHLYHWKKTKLPNDQDRAKFPSNIYVCHANYNT